MRKLTFLVAALVALTATSFAVAHGIEGAKNATAVAGTFTATAGATSSRTCTTSDNKTIVVTDAKYTGTATGAADLTGPITLRARSVVNTTDGVGTVTGSLAVDASGKNTRAAYSAVYAHGKIAGLAVGRAHESKTALLANLSAAFDPATGFTNGKLGGGTDGGSAVEIGSSGAKPAEPTHEKSSARGTISLLRLLEPPRRPGRSGLRLRDLGRRPDSDERSRRDDGGPGPVGEDEHRPDDLRRVRRRRPGSGKAARRRPLRRRRRPPGRSEAACARPGPARKLRSSRRGRAGRRDRQPVRKRRFALRRCRFRHAPLDPVADDQVRPDRRHSDRRPDQPRELGRAALRRAGTRDRDQRPDPLQRQQRRVRGRRFRRPDRLGEALARPDREDGRRPLRLRRDQDG